MQTEAQKRAKSRYRQRNEKRIGVTFYPKDRELYEWVKESGGAAFLRALAYTAQAKEKPLD